MAGDILVCGDCRKDFPLSCIVNFLHHKQCYCCQFPSEGQDILTCGSCPKTFNSSWDLLRHAQEDHKFAIFSHSSHDQAQGHIGERLAVGDCECAPGRIDAAVQTCEEGREEGKRTRGNSGARASQDHSLGQCQCQSQVQGQDQCQCQGQCQSDGRGGCCDRAECGVTVMPGTHENLKKCCIEVVPKKRKRHMETKHLQAFTGRLRKRAMGRVRDSWSPPPNTDTTRDTINPPTESQNLGAENKVKGQGHGRKPVLKQSKGKAGFGKSEALSLKDCVPNITKSVPVLQCCESSQAVPATPPESGEGGEVYQCCLQSLADTRQLYEDERNQTSPEPIRTPEPCWPQGLPLISTFLKPPSNSTTHQNLPDCTAAPSAPQGSMTQESLTKNALKEDSFTQGCLMQEIEILTQDSLNLDSITQNALAQECLNQTLENKLGTMKDRPSAKIVIPIVLQDQGSRSLQQLEHGLEQGQDKGQSHGSCSKKRRYPTSRPFKCGECDLAFNQRIHLRKHESKHTGIKPYKCEQCDYATVERSHLRVHNRVHTGEKPYKCQHCDYATAQNSTLKIHLKRHHGRLCPAARQGEKAVPYKE